MCGVRCVLKTPAPTEIYTLSLHDARPICAVEDEAMAAIRSAGFYPMLIDVPAECNEDHWHDFDAMIFVLEGVNVVTVAATGETLRCGPGSRADFPRGVIHREHHEGFRALYGLSVDPATLTGPVSFPPKAWVG